MPGKIFIKIDISKTYSYFLINCVSKQTTVDKVEINYVEPGCLAAGSGSGRSAGWQLHWLGYSCSFPAEPPGPKTRGRQPPPVGQELAQDTPKHTRQNYQLIQIKSRSFMTVRDIWVSYYYLSNRDTACVYPLSMQGRKMQRLSDFPALAGNILRKEETQQWRALLI